MKWIVLTLNSSTHLEKKDLRSLARDEMAAIRIRRFIDPHRCAHIANRLLDHNGRTEHLSVPGLQLLGLPFYLAARSPAATLKYYEEAQYIPKLLGELAAPFESPLNQIWHVLASTWNAGVVREKLMANREMSPAIIRFYSEGVGIPPHNDILADEAPNERRAHSLVAQFGLNLFLSSPEEGGTLELYRRQYPPEVYETLTIPGTQDLDRALIGPPDSQIQPETGDLIFNLSRNIHAVTPVKGTKARLTLSSFVGMRTSEEPLTLWA